MKRMLVEHDERPDQTILRFQWVHCPKGCSGYPYEWCSRCEFVEQDDAVADLESLRLGLRGLLLKWEERSPALADKTTLRGCAQELRQLLEHLGD